MFWAPSEKIEEHFLVVHLSRKFEFFFFLCEVPISFFGQKFGILLTGKI
jgi:hypothetical protein